MIAFAGSLSACTLRARHFSYFDHIDCLIFKHFHQSKLFVYRKRRSDNINVCFRNRRKHFFGIWDRIGKAQPSLVRNAFRQQFKIEQHIVHAVIHSTNDLDVVPFEKVLLELEPIVLFFAHLLTPH